MYSLKKTFRYLAPHIWRYKWSGITLFLAYGLGYIIAQLVVPFFYREIIDAIVANPDPAVVKDTLPHIVILLAVTGIAYNLLYRVADWAYMYFEGRVYRDLQNQSFEHITLHSYQFFADHFTGALISKVNRFVRSFSDILDRVVWTFWLTGLLLIT